MAYLNDYIINMGSSKCTEKASGSPDRNVHIYSLQLSDNSVPCGRTYRANGENITSDIKHQAYLINHVEGAEFLKNALESKQNTKSLSWANTKQFPRHTTVYFSSSL